MRAEPVWNPLPHLGLHAAAALLLAAVHPEDLLLLLHDILAHLASRYSSALCKYLGKVKEDAGFKWFKL